MANISKIKVDNTEYDLKDSSSYKKPSGGIPKTDLAQAVQDSLDLADSAIQAHQDISGKADKTTTVSTVTYDTTNKKITKTINGTTTDVVTAANIVTDGGGITSHQDISGKQDKVGVLGSTSKPVYTSASGTFAECSTYAGGTAVTLNGTGKGGDTATFYAPTTSGTAGQVLVAGGNNTAPSWLTIASTITCAAIISELT